MKLFRFLDWEVYNDAQKLFGEIVGIVRKLPNDFRFTLGDQIIRSTLSIILNISEGSGRNTEKELKRFLDIATGSINETVAGVDALARADLIAVKERDNLFEKLESISRQLGGFKKHIG